MHILTEASVITVFGLAKETSKQNTKMLYAFLLISITGFIELTLFMNKTSKQNTKMLYAFLLISITGFIELTLFMNITCWFVFTGYRQWHIICVNFSYKMFVSGACGNLGMHSPMLCPELKKSKVMAQ
jgi:hypothetical protein